MNNYFDFVLCKMESSRTFLFHAPAFSKLKKGDLVKVEHLNMEKMATVVSCISLAENDDTKIDFVMNATHSEPDVGKVLGKYEYSDFEYEEDMENHNEKSGTDS